MSYDDAFDFYEEFDKHPNEFQAASTYQEFCALVGGKLWEHLATYRWVPAVFATAKAGKRTARALAFPLAQKFSDLFQSAQLVVYKAGQDNNPRGTYFLGGHGAVNDHLGGERGWSKTSPNTRSHFKATFYSTYVTPTSEVKAIIPRDPYTSFEGIRRDDGILIIARDSKCIYQTYIALIDSSEDIRVLFDEKTKAFLESERQAEIAAWGEVEQ